MPIGIYDCIEYWNDKELEDFQEKFNGKDPDRTGLIDDFEVPGLIAIWFPKHVSKQALKKAFHAVNTTEQGKVDFEEFVVIMIKATSARRRADLIDYTDYLESYQMKELQKLFSRYATEGSIQPEGLPVLFNDLGLVELDTQTLETIIQEVDKDGSGEIEFDEFCCMWVVLSNCTKRINYREFLHKDQIQLYRKAFELTDQDGSGWIDIRELMALFKRLGLGYTTEQVEEQLALTDADNNGQLSFDEFCILMVGIGSEKRKKMVNKNTYTMEMLQDENFSIADIKRAGFDLGQLRGHYGPKRLCVEGGYTALEFRLAGFMAQEMATAGFEPMELRKAGYSNTELRNLGWSAQILNQISKNLTDRLSTEEIDQVLPQTNQSGHSDASSLPIHMTPRIRFHTDYKPKLSANAGKIPRSNNGDDKEE